MSRWIRRGGMLWVLGSALVLTADIAQACPFCREALAGSDNRVPMAYMYSILFMLAMPPTILGGIAFTIWRACRKHAEAAATSPATAASVEPSLELPPAVVSLPS